MTKGQRSVRISVVIASHNTGPFLHEAIDSALAQAHPGHEIVAVANRYKVFANMMYRRARRRG